MLSLICLVSHLGQGYQACGVTEHVKGLIEARGLSHNPTPSEHLATRDTEELVSTKGVSS